MSVITLPVYRSEAGVMSNPAVNASVYTHCNDGSNNVKKTFKEVFLHWDGAAWVKDDTWQPEEPTEIVALEVYNPCTDTFSWINVGFNDFRLYQLCCQFIPPVPLGLRLNFQDIAQALALVDDPTNVADWNTLFNTGIKAATPFSSVIVTATSVILVGATDLQLFAQSLQGVVGLVSVIDEVNCVIEVEDQAISACPDLTTVTLPVCTMIFNRGLELNPALVNVNLPSATTVSNSALEGCTGLVTLNLPSVLIIGGSCFRDCSSLQTVIAPLATTVTGFAFRNCDALVLVDLRANIPFGGTSGDDVVFFEVAGATFELIIASGQETDGDIVAVQAVNTVTLTLIS